MDRGASGSRLGDLAVKGMGWRPGMLTDPIVGDRFRWLRGHTRAGARTLDAGCGSGWFALFLASRGNEVLGVSFDERANAAAGRRAAILGYPRVRFRQADLQQLDRFGDELGQFDEVICFETIEHIPDDAKLVRDLARRLKPGGHLFMTTPSDDHRPLMLDAVAAEAEGGHVRFGYSPGRLRELCEAAGLRVVEERRLGGFIVQALFQLTGRLTPALGFRAATLVALILRPLKLLDRPITRLLGTKELCISVMAEKVEAA